MSFFLDFNEFKLFEKNRIRQYFEENPDKIKKFQNLTGYGNDFDVYDLAKEIYKEDNPIHSKYVENLNKLKKLKNILFSEELADTKVKNSVSYWDIFNNGNFIDQFNYSSKTKKIKSYEDFEIEMKDYISKNGKSFTDTQFNYIKQHWNEFYNLTLNIEKYRNLEKSWAYNKLKKEALNHGFEPEDFAKVFSWIKYYTGMSRRKLPPELWPVINILTVDNNSLPEYVYRGIFYDGAKIKDQEAFKQKWAKGNKPKEPLRKATSWSASRKVAINFMTSQDFIKNTKSGYHILLKLKVKPEFVIADLRNIENNEYWSQQEIIINPIASKEYEVDEIIPYKDTDYDNPEKGTYRDFIKTNTATNASSYGQTKGELMSKIFQLNNIDVDNNIIINWKIIKDMTAYEVEKKAKTQLSGWTTVDAKKLLYPLFSFIHLIWIKNGNLYPTEVISQTSVICAAALDISTETYNFDENGEVTKALMKIFKASDKKELEKHKLPYGYRVEIPVKITLIENNINRFVFNIEVIPEVHEIKNENYRINDKTRENKEFVFKELSNNYKNELAKYVENSINKSIKEYKVIKVNFIKK